MTQPIILISHDLNMVHRWADRVLVLNKGVCEELGTAKQLFQQPKSPYTKGLINAVPPVDRRPKRLQTIEDFINDTPKAANETKTSRSKRHKQLYEQSPFLEVKGLQKINKTQVLHLILKVGQAYKNQLLKNICLYDQLVLTCFYTLYYNSNDIKLNINT